MNKIMTISLFCFLTSISFASNQKNRNMAIDSLQKLTINNSEQWILVRGKNKDAPLILQVQAGPGLPQICYAEAMQKNLEWENDYIVVYWDQRACGKSYSKNTDPNTINLQQSADDILACTKYLLQTYHKEKITLIGYSLGATAAFMAASKDNSMFNNLVLVGIDIDLNKANKFAFNFAKEQALKQKDTKVLKQIQKLENEPIVNAKLFEERAKILSKFGGIVVTKTYNQLFVDALKYLWQSKAYKLSDILKTVKGIAFCQNALLPKIEHFNLFESKIYTTVPVHFVQGAKDAIAPLELMQLYFEYLNIPNKSLTIFDNSAHMPQLEEPKKFYKLITTLK